MPCIHSHSSLYFSLEYVLPPEQQITWSPFSLSLYYILALLISLFILMKTYRQWIRITTASDAECVPVPSRSQNSPFTTDDSRPTSSAIPSISLPTQPLNPSTFTHTYLHPHLLFTIYRFLYSKMNPLLLI